MFFSVIIPVYNRAALLSDCLDSVAAQAERNFEVIVVDDGSTDDSSKVAQEHPLAPKVLRQPNRGPGAARNSGAAETRGDYLVFLDSDDIWFPWTLATFATLIRTHVSPAVLVSRVQEFQEERELSLTGDEEPQGAFFDDYLAASKTGYYIGSGMAVIDRNEFFKSGGYVESAMNAEDHDLALRLGTARGFVQVLAPVTLGWRRHQESLTRDVRRTFEGNLHLVRQEQRGAFPGGAGRAAERREIIARHARPAALACLRHRMYSEAWALYWGTFPWHLRLRRARFLAGFPFVALFEFLRNSPTRSSDTSSEGCSSGEDKKQTSPTAAGS